MWFKSLNGYAVTERMPEESDIEARLQEHAFIEEGPKVAKKVGFVPPVSFHDNLSHSVMGATLICIKEETRTVPADVVAEELAKRVKELESRGEEVSRSFKKELKEEIVQRLFPKVMPKVKRSYAFIDDKEKRIVVDESSRKKGEERIFFIREALDVAIVPIQTMENPGRKLRYWTETQFPKDLGPGSKCKLFMRSDNRDKVNYSGHEISEDSSIQDYIGSGYEISEMEVRQWIDGDPMIYTLTEDLLIKSIGYSEYIKNEVSEDSTDLASEIDGTFIAVVGVSRTVYKKLFEVLGGISLG